MAQEIHRPHLVTAHCKTYCTGLIFKKKGMHLLEILM
jgi:hypothetical protein